MNHQLYIVMYHYVRDLENSRYPLMKGLDYSLFVKQIEFILEHFTVVTMEEVLKAVQEKEEYSLPEKAILLTFDDGYADHYTYVYPILKKYGIQGSFFMPAKIGKEHKVLDVNKIHHILAAFDMNRLLPFIMEKLNLYRKSGYEIEKNETLFQKLAKPNRWDTGETIFVKRLLQNELPEKLRNQMTSELFEEAIGVKEEVFSRELYLSMEQIQCMKQGGMYFGIHGYDHYWLGKLNSEDMKQDIEKALYYFEGIIEKNQWVMNYPYGSFNQEVIDFVKEKGCKLGLGVEARRAVIGTDSDWALPRFDTNDFPPKAGKIPE